MRQAFLTCHRWLSLAAALFWIVQALTGALIAFHWELRDASFAGPHRATDVAAIGARIEKIEANGGPRVESLWTTAGFADRYTLFLSDGGSLDIAGDGTPLRLQSPAVVTSMNTLIDLHHGSIAGETGEWIVGISGVLLVTNLLLALRLAWPRRGTWRRTLRPPLAGNRAARSFALHRAIGLWVVAPALVLVATGTMLRFESGTERLIGYEAAEPAPVPPAGRAMAPFGTAVAAGLAAIPGSRLVSVTMPTADDALYRLRVLEPGELRRAYGTSTVVINGLDGTVVAIAPASGAAPKRTFMETLFALHTGEAGGLPGRILIALLGLGLAAVVVLGILLWLARRRRPRPAPQARPA